jgi:hypothetical protein
MPRSHCKEDELEGKQQIGKRQTDGKRQTANGKRQTANGKASIAPAICQTCITNDLHRHCADAAAR